MHLNEDDVLAIQKMLAEEGLLHGEPNGVWTPYTQNAWEAHASRNGMLPPQIYVAPINRDMLTQAALDAVNGFVKEIETTENEVEETTNFTTEGGDQSTADFEPAVETTEAEGTAEAEVVAEEVAEVVAEEVVEVAAEETTAEVVEVAAEEITEEVVEEAVVETTEEVATEEVVELGEDTPA